MEERGRKIARTKIGGVWGEQLLPIPLILSLALLLVFVHALPCERLETNWCKKFCCLFSFTPTVKGQYAVFSTLRVI